MKIILFAILLVTSPFRTICQDSKHWPILLGYSKENIKQINSDNQLLKEEPQFISYKLNDDLLISFLFDSKLSCESFNISVNYTYEYKLLRQLQEDGWYSIDKEQSIFKNNLNNFFRELVIYKTYHNPFVYFMFSIDQTKN